ncbi:hypothetical protein SAMN04489724_0726 [Algoriphagus locisalis]|uniref:Uncharacterized protein n=1 Tax=Algoriphagus locisalis TaxID=305507 RepID=A0A1I6XXX2_9BACT|nr:hypothetical protein [Algoriphagus locisalis]SFT43160.1 hypothetical protein SAMN04489724_0726 [Algoriphagus locisalis]
MQKIPKIKDFKAPDNYFESLPERIMDRIQPNRSFHWMKYAAAAAILIISLGVWQFNTSTSQFETLAMDEEVNLYIESQYWTAEDVLTMVDNPEEILDQILAEEMVYEVEDLSENDQNWY